MGRRAVVVAAAGLALAGWEVRRLRGAMTMETDHAAYWRRRARSPGTLVLVALGDSLAQGMGAVHPERSWAGRLADHLERRTGRPVRVVNLATCGARTTDVARDQLPALDRVQGADVVVALAVGTNDAAALRRGEQDPERFRAELAAVCAALPTGALVADVPDLQRGRVRAHGATLSAIAREVIAATPGLVPVALEDATRRMRLREFGPDLAHPNGRGYRRFGRAFTDAWDRASGQASGSERRAPSLG